MAGLTTVIWTNGVVHSTYDDGTPADDFSGKLPILYNIFKNIKDTTLIKTADRRLINVRFYISNDPLCINKMEVTASYLRNILQYFRFSFLKLLKVPQALSNFSF
jgi:hypothetical protein